MEVKAVRHRSQGQDESGRLPQTGNEVVVGRGQEFTLLVWELQVSVGIFVKITHGCLLFAAGRLEVPRPKY